MGEVILIWWIVVKFIRVCVWSWKGKREDLDRFKRYL